MEATLLRTPLYARHVALGARMVPFAGYEMPVQYEGVIEEHRAVRTDAGAFDVSHMGEIHVDGPTAQAFLQSMLSNDIDTLGDGDAQYTLLTNESGGIVDDLIAYRLAHGQFYLVVNASNRVAVYDWLKEREPRGCEVRDASDEYGLVAVQGPRALERLGLPEAPAFTHAMGALEGIEVMVARTGYTGEQGVELCCAEDQTEDLWDAILTRGVTPCGLGARDTLRLEVCYPLHGNDITPETDAISAGLGWACALETAFTGAETLRRLKEDGPARKLVPFVMEERAVPRRGMPIEGGGEVTSGTHSPMLDVGIGMGYVPTAFATPDTELVIDVRGKPRRARVVKKPIYRKEP
ncbi:MAG TPA: glycine cleavage system aminomethyltransferase GcvT [Gaiellaceae bacterium]|nr:glycine cleavage system aminomethyltransferase GcvT [Gaiellaceae bacterium]